MRVNIVVEGDVDQAVASKLLIAANMEVGIPYIRNGKMNLDARLGGYNSAARHSRWLVLRDLDHDAQCAPTLVRTLLPAPSVGMLLRIAVRSIESWLMADKDALADYLGVAPVHIPQRPEENENPKNALVNIARRSRSRTIRETMVPGENSGRRVGPEFTATMVLFADRHWSIERAVEAEAAPSLNKALAALQARTEDWIRLH